MGWIIVIAVTIAVIAYFYSQSAKPDLSVLPDQFVVFDLETTGLKPDVDEIIEIGAIRVNRDSKEHNTFQALIRPSKSIPDKIVKITGITQKMVDDDGGSLAEELPQFLDFIGDLRLVSYNAKFDMAFLNNAIDQIEPARAISNPVSCALKMARRAWPGRDSYRLADLARDGGLEAQTHRALDDCKQALTIYTAAAAALRAVS